MVVLIDKEATGEVAVGRRILAPLREARSSPLVPACNEDELRVELQGAIPLFLKVQSKMDGSLAGVLRAMVPTATHGTLTV